MVCEYMRAKGVPTYSQNENGKKVFWESPSQCIYRMDIGFFDPMWLPMVISDPWYFPMVFSLLGFLHPF